MAQFVVVDPPGLFPHELAAAVVPRRPATLAPLAARGLGRRARDGRRRGGQRAEGRSARRLPTDREPYGVDGPVVWVLGVAGSFVAAGSMVASAVSLIVRMRRAGSEQRQQIKWLAYGGAMVVGTIFVGSLVILWSVPVSIVIMSVALLGLPVFTGTAIVRYRLYDIDLLINRTLVYGSLTLMLALVYFGGVTEPRLSSKR